VVARREWADPARKDMVGQYYQDGRQIRISTKTHVRSEALTVLRKLRNSRDKGEVPTSDVRKLKYADLRANRQLHRTGQQVAQRAGGRHREHRWVEGT
jgi:hypothetical protein